MKSIPPCSDAQLARLLSGRNELSVIERERLREQILNATSTGVPSWHRFLAPRPVVLGALSTVAAAALVVLVVRVGIEPIQSPDRRDGGAQQLSQTGASGRSADEREEYVARGGVPGPGLRLACVGLAGHERCERGSKLTFAVRRDDDWRYFSAFAQAQDGTVFWYFPEPGPTARAVELGSDAMTVLDSAVVLGDEAGGSLTVYGLFTRVPMTRVDIKRAMGPTLKGDGTVRIVKRRLTVRERE